LEVPVALRQLVDCGAPTLTLTLLLPSPYMTPPLVSLTPEGSGMRRGVSYMVCHTKYKSHFSPLGPSGRGVMGRGSGIPTLRRRADPTA